jgi:hypothetical protein
MPLRRIWIPSTPSNTHFESVVPAETNPSELDYVTKDETLHYATIVGGSWLRERAIFDEAKKSHVRSFILGFVQRLRSVRYNSWDLSVNRCFTSCSRYLIQCDSGSRLPFHLVVETRGQKSICTPRSDFLMCIKDFPHLLLEVNSQSNESDRFRMLLQASCIARIGNWLRTSTSRKPITIMAIYIDKYFKANQYLLYQPDVGSTEVM